MGFKNTAIPKHRTTLNHATLLYSTLPNTTHYNFKAAVQRQLGQLLTLRGFVTRQWGTLNLEEVLVRIFGVH